MNSKTKYLLLTLGIIGIFLMIFNSVKMWYWYDFKTELEISQIFFLVVLISFGLYFIITKYRKFLTKIIIVAFGISLILNIHLLTENFENILRQNRLSEYTELETCEKMESRFATDLKKEELKYFHFGIASISGMRENMESNYDIEYFSMGCLLRTEMECYNKLVNKHLKEKFNKSINDIYEEIETE
ncbi:hypothetical protein KO506_12905 [Polaribacter vadi]|uniref:FEKKY domain-containing protein n=1 Tax=Polaribacter TaxID=52959 RepID=UPI001C08EC10|nr:MULTISPECIES: hypothetical protein [Polaribacter]MBU3012308.1 hypothetical protein [Polaribacter vadi]MDO6742125.1 hypothetical protein [Polaribacter sp. 1_MG-2023]